MPYLNDFLLHYEREWKNKKANQHLQDDLGWAINFFFLQILVGKEHMLVKM